MNTDDKYLSVIGGVCALVYGERLTREKLIKAILWLQEIKDEFEGTDASVYAATALEDLLGLETEQVES